MNAFKELAPIIYGESGIKLQQYIFEAGQMCFPAHWHGRAELLRISSGNMEVYLDNKHITATSGQVILIMPGRIHCGFAGETGVDYHMIAFDIEKYCNHTIASDKYMVPLFKYETAFSSVTDHAEIVNTVDNLIHILMNEDDTNPLFAVGKIFELIGLLYQHCISDSGNVHKPDERFGTVLAYINKHYTEDISAKNISHKFGYDETYFCRRFKEATGITTMKYIRLLRLEHAQELLQNTADDIRNIAWKCGFSDICYFSNCFKRHFGMTPTEYRNMSKRDGYMVTKK